MRFQLVPAALWSLLQLAFDSFLSAELDRDALRFGLPQLAMFTPRPEMAILGAIITWKIDSRVTSPNKR